MIRVAYILESYDLTGAEKSVFHIVKYLDKTQFTPVMISLESGGQLEEKFIKHNIENYVVNTGSIFSLKGLIKLYTLLREINVNIIHTNTTKSHIQSRIVGFFLKNKFVVSSYRNEPKWLQSNNFNDVLRKLIDKYTARFLCDSLVYVSKSTFRYFKDHGYKNFKTQVIYNSIETDLIGKINCSRHDLMKRFNINNNHKVIVAIGRLTEQKGYEFLFPAIDQVSKKINNIKLLIFGEDQSSGYYENLLKKYNYIDVFITDSYPKILEVLSISDVFVSSSLWEGLPRAHLESLLSGCVVISTNIGGSNEIIINEYNGILVEPRSVSELVKAVEKVLNSDSLVDTFKENGYKVLKNKFDIKKNTRKLEKLYLSLYRDE